MQDMQNVVYIMNSKWNGQTNTNTSMFKQLILQKYEKKNMKRKNTKKQNSNNNKNKHIESCEATQLCQFDNQKNNL